MFINKVVFKFLILAHCPFMMCIPCGNIPITSYQQELIDATESESD